MFMQLWGGHSPAGSAARSAPALTRQSPRHRHARPSHKQTDTDTQRDNTQASKHTHTHAQVCTRRHGTLTHTDTQRNTCTPPADAGGGCEGGGPSPQPLSPPPGACAPSTLTPRWPRTGATLPAGLWPRTSPERKAWHLSVPCSPWRLLKGSLAVLGWGSRSEVQGQAGAGGCAEYWPHQAALCPD